MVSAPVKFSELSDALEFVSAGGTMDAEAYICRDTGRIYWRGDDVGDEDQLPDDLDSDRYLTVPDKKDLDLGRGLVFAFIEDAAPDDYNRVRGFFQRRGAYARFRDLLHERGLLDRWYDFENKATEQALRDWCEANGIQLAREAG